MNEIDYDKELDKLEKFLVDNDLLTEFGRIIDMNFKGMRPPRDFYFSRSELDDSNWYKVGLGRVKLLWSYNVAGEVEDITFYCGNQAKSVYNNLMRNKDIITFLSNNNFNKDLKQESRSLGAYNIENSMSDDKQLFLDSVKEKILDRNNKYKDLYLSDTFAFLAPDNYDAETADEIEVSTKEQLGQAEKEFDKICIDIIKNFIWACEETNDTYVLNHIKPWRVRDFISEAQYQALKYEDNHKAFAMWKRVVNIGLQILTDDMTCVSEHLSYYDKL